MLSASDNLAARLLDGALDPDRGTRVAVREGDRSWTRAELHERVVRVAAAVRALGVGRGERVALLMRDSLDTAAALLGVIYAGAVAVPLSELCRPIDVREYLRHAGAIAAIVHADLADTLDAVRTELPDLREVIRVGGDPAPGERSWDAWLAAATPVAEPAAVAPDHPAMILYTGTDPEHELRGVPHTHAAPLAAADCFARGVIGLGPADRVLSIVRLSNTYGLGTGLLFPLAAGAETALLRHQPKSDAIFAALEAFAPTVFLATPSIYGQLARDAERSGRELPLAGLRACVSGAEGLPPKLVPKIRDVLGTQVIVGYGLTEAFQFVLAGTAGAIPLGSCGRPVPGYEARIVDDADAPLGPDVIGTLQIRGPTLLSSYWGANPDSADGAPSASGWFTTRDRFMRDEQGNYYHCGRQDDLFKVGGKWVSPTELERVLLANEAVWECAVIGADDEDGLSKPLAFVVPNIGHEPGDALERELREYVKNALAPYKYPRWIEFVDRLPKGPHGKILRYKLRATGARRAATADGE